MKTGDILAILYVLLYAAVVFFFPLNYRFSASDLLELKTVPGLYWAGFDFAGSFSDLIGLKNFGNVVKAYPYITGFFKVALLATFGEMLKTRGRTGSWKTPDLLPKFVVWGLFGMLFSLVFALFAMGVERMSVTNIWPGPAVPYSYATATWGWRIFMAFSSSFWCNIIFCFPMMLGHEWFNDVIKHRKFVGGAEFLGSLDKHVWGSFMPKTIIYFWVPAHTVTFSLPPDYRVLMSAVLSLALGFILTVKPKKKSA